MDRRRLLQAAAGVALAPSLAPSAVHAQAPAWPNRPIRLLLGFTPGGATDITARLLAQHMSRLLGQNIVVENRPGAAGNIAMDALARSPADGYTIMYTTSTTHGINPTLYTKLPFDPIKDFAPIMRVGRTTMVLLASPTLNVRSATDLVAQAKEKPGQFAYASAGPGSTFHLTTELFARQAGIRLLHVPYKGSGPALVGLMAGDVQLMFDNVSSSQTVIRSGKVRPMAVLARERVRALPDVPTFAEAGVTPQFLVNSWGGLVAPAATPPAVVARLNAVANEALRSPEVRQTMLDNASEPQGGTPEEFAAFIRSEIAFWGDAVRMTGATAD